MPEFVAAAPLLQVYLLGNRNNNNAAVGTVVVQEQVVEIEWLRGKHSKTADGRVTAYLCGLMALSLHSSASLAAYKSLYTCHVPPSSTSVACFFCLSHE